MVYISASGSTVWGLGSGGPNWRGGFNESWSCPEGKGDRVSLASANEVLLNEELLNTELLNEEHPNEEFFNKELPHKELLNEELPNEEPLNEEPP